MIDSEAVRRLALHAINWVDHARFGLFRARLRQQLELDGPVSPHFRLTELQIEQGARIRIGEGLATERRRGNHIWVQEGGLLELGPRTWLRTEYGANRVTVFPHARIRLGPDGLINGAMLHAKQEISIGSDFRLGFGARILDADLHALDCETPERIAAVRIGDRVWIGSDVTVLRGVTIGDDVVVGAGSIVTGDLPARCLALGRPARVVREIASRVGCG